MSTSLLPEAELERLYGLGERIKLAIIEGNLERAHALVDAGPAVLAPEEIYDPLDPGSAPIAAVIADVRLANAVEEHTGALDAAAFVALDVGELYAIPNVGLKRAEELLAIQTAWRQKIAEAGRV